MKDHCFTARKIAEQGEISTGTANPNGHFQAEIGSLRLLAVPETDNAIELQNRDKIMQNTMMGLNINTKEAFISVFSCGSNAGLKECEKAQEAYFELD
ncbi:hypothetical protein TNCV_2539881 [Trichonephila clavipes]|nr:hypothetical protein TNCV_2539881 [Trichonephila clavipes]